MSQLLTLASKPQWWQWVSPKALPKVCPRGSDGELGALIWARSRKRRMKRSVSHVWILNLLSSPFRSESFSPGTLIFKLERIWTAGPLKRLAWRWCSGEFHLLRDWCVPRGRRMHTRTPALCLACCAGPARQLWQLRWSSDWRKQSPTICLLSPRPWQRFLTFAELCGWSRTAKYLFVIGVECWTFCACSWGLNINSRCYWIEGLSQLLRPFSTWIFWLMTILVTRLIMK